MADKDGPDWQRWHREYELPGSRLERRLREVQALLTRALSTAPAGELRLLSACAGEGRDVLGVLSRHPRTPDVSALLVEADPDVAARATARVLELDLGVTVRVGDAGHAGAYASIVPVDIALFCGVFGNITVEDVARTIVEMRSLLAPHGRVLWTRGRDQDHDPTGDIRLWFQAAGFVEEAFIAPRDDGYLAGRSSFTVGMHRLSAEPREYDPEVRLFGFIGHKRVGA
jgi:hypothetical protein